MSFKIVIKSKKIFEKDFSSIPYQYQKIISGKIQDLSHTGLLQAQVKRLTHYKICDYRLRVGDYRVLFDVDEEKSHIVIFRILHRSKLY